MTPASYKITTHLSTFQTGLLELDILPVIQGDVGLLGLLITVCPDGSFQLFAFSSLTLRLFTLDQHIVNILNSTYQLITHLIYIFLNLKINSEFAFNEKSGDAT